MHFFSFFPFFFVPLPDCVPELLSLLQQNIARNSRALAVQPTVQRLEWDEGGGCGGNSKRPSGAKLVAQKFDTIIASDCVVRLGPYAYITWPLCILDAYCIYWASPRSRLLLSYRISRATCVAPRYKSVGAKLVAQKFDTIVASDCVVRLVL
jgi:hypothetical protein